MADSLKDGHGLVAFPAAITTRLTPAKFEECVQTPFGVPDPEHYVMAIPIDPGTRSIEMNARARRTLGLLQILLVQFALKHDITSEDGIRKCRLYSFAIPTNDDRKFIINNVEMRDVCAVVYWLVHFNQHRDPVAAANQGYQEKKAAQEKPGLRDVVSLLQYCSTNLNNVRNLTALDLHGKKIMNTAWDPLAAMFDASQFNAEVTSYAPVYFSEWEQQGERDRSTTAWHGHDLRRVFSVENARRHIYQAMGGKHVQARHIMSDDYAPWVRRDEESNEDIATVPYAADVYEHNNGTAHVVKGIRWMTLPLTAFHNGGLNTAEYAEFVQEHQHMPPALLRITWNYWYGLNNSLRGLTLSQMLGAYKRQAERILSDMSVHHWTSAEDHHRSHNHLQSFVSLLHSWVAAHNCPDDLYELTQATRDVLGPQRMQNCLGAFSIRVSSWCTHYGVLSGFLKRFQDYACHVRRFGNAPMVTKLAMWCMTASLEDNMNLRPWLVVVGNPGGGKSAMIFFFTEIFSNGAAITLELHSSRLAGMDTDHSCTIVLQDDASSAQFTPQANGGNGEQIALMKKSTTMATKTVAIFGQQPDGMWRTNSTVSSNNKVIFTLTNDSTHSWDPALLQRAMVDVTPDLSSELQQDVAMHAFLQGHMKTRVSSKNLASWMSFARMATTWTHLCCSAGTETLPEMQAATQLFQCLRTMYERCDIRWDLDLRRFVNMLRLTQHLALQRVIMTVVQLGVVPRIFTNDKRYAPYDNAAFIDGVRPYPPLEFAPPLPCVPAMVEKWRPFMTAWVSDAIHAWAMCGCATQPLVVFIANALRRDFVEDKEHVISIVEAHEGDWAVREDYLPLGLSGADAAQDISHVASAAAANAPGVISSWFPPVDDRRLERKGRSASGAGGGGSSFFSYSTDRLVSLVVPKLAAKIASRNGMNVTTDALVASLRGLFSAPMPGSQSPYFKAFMNQGSHTVALHIHTSFFTAYPPLAVYKRTASKVSRQINTAPLELISPLFDVLFGAPPSANVMEINGVAAESDDEEKKVARESEEQRLTRRLDEDTARAEEYVLRIRERNDFLWRMKHEAQFPEAQVEKAFRNGPNSEPVFLLPNQPDPVWEEMQEQKRRMPAYQPLVWQPASRGADAATYMTNKVRLESYHKGLIEADEKMHRDLQRSIAQCRSRLQELAANKARVVAHAPVLAERTQLEELKKSGFVNEATYEDLRRFTESARAERKDVTDVDNRASIKRLKELGVRYPEQHAGYAKNLNFLTVQAGELNKASNAAADAFARIVHAGGEPDADKIASLSERAIDMVARTLTVMESAKRMSLYVPEFVRDSWSKFPVLGPDYLRNVVLGELYAAATDPDGINGKVFGDAKHCSRVRFHACKDVLLPWLREQMMPRVPDKLKEAAETLIAENSMVVPYEQAAAEYKREEKVPEEVLQMLDVEQFEQAEEGMESRQERWRREAAKRGQDAVARARQRRRDEDDEEGDQDDEEEEMKHEEVHAANLVRAESFFSAASSSNEDSRFADEKEEEEEAGEDGGGDDDEKARNPFDDKYCDGVKGLRERRKKHRRAEATNGRKRPRDPDGESPTPNKKLRHFFSIEAEVEEGDDSKDEDDEEENDDYEIDSVAEQVVPEHPSDHPGATSAGDMLDEEPRDFRKILQRLRRPGSA